MHDSQIIDLLFRRSEQAVTALQQRFGGLCKSVISRILPDGRDVEECVSDTYLRVWKSIPPQRPERLDSYVARIARNAALDRYDYNSALTRNSAMTLAFEELEHYIPSQKRSCDASEFRSFLNRFLRGLPKETRILFIRRYWYGESIREIAAASGYSEEKVKTLLFRTRNKLRVEMTQEEIYL